MYITVTKEDIELGQRRDPEQCAVAKALLRAGLEHLGVMGPSVMVSDGWGRLTSVKLPEVVSDWIFNFDAGNAVAPFSFEVEMPSPTLTKRSLPPGEPPRDDTCKLQVERDLGTSLTPTKAKPCYRRRTTLKVPKLGSKRRGRFNLSFKVG